MTKRDSVCNFLDAGGVTRLYVQPRGCLVPWHVQGHTWVLVDVDRAACPDLSTSQDGVYATLTFDSTTMFCFVPWDDVHAAKHISTGTIVSWTSEATAYVRAEHASATTPEPTPRVHEESNVVDLRAWRLSHGR